MKEHAKTLIDWGAAGTMVATFFGWLPHIAAVLTVVWTGLRIFDWIEGRLKARKP